MERLLEHLQRRQSRGVVERVDVERLLADVVRRCSDRAPQPKLHCDANAVVVEADPDEFAMVMVHIVRNAQDATPADGGVTIRAAYADGQLDIEVADTGTGMSAEFIRDELFRPFHTTKSSKGMGIGAHQAREFVRGLGGRVTVQSEPGAGTRFRLALPARMAERPAPQMKMGATGPS
jgi:signal transduction histidine kinase